MTDALAKSIFVLRWMMKRLLGVLIAATFPVIMNAEPANEKTAVVGGGCFWCVEALYQGVPGIKSVVSGYAGGTVPNPTYQQVCSGRTGHAEVVQITYDPAQTSYEKVLDLFWMAHDPTTLNRQGADTGTQYRSIILYQTPEEKALAENSKKKAQKDFRDPITTEIVPLEAFYPAEKYHQNFYQNNPEHPYNQAVIAPKLEKFREAEDKVLSTK